MYLNCKQRDDTKNEWGSSYIENRTANLKKKSLNVVRLIGSRDCVHPNVLHYYEILQTTAVQIFFKIRLF